MTDERGSRESFDDGTTGRGGGLRRMAGRLLGRRGRGPDAAAESPPESVDDYLAPTPRVRSATASPDGAEVAADTEPPAPAVDQAAEAGVEDVRDPASGAVPPSPPPPPADDAPPGAGAASATETDQAGEIETVGDGEPVDDAAAEGAAPPSVPLAAASLTDSSTDVTEEAPVAAGVAGLQRRTTPLSAYVAVLSVLATMVILAFVLMEPSPRWLLLFGAAAVVLGLDGTLRQTWREPFALGQETAPFLFVPALYMLAVPVLVEHNVRGELVVLAGLAAGGGFAALAWAELASVRAYGDEYPLARTVVTGGSYLVGFAIFSLSYVFEVGLPAAIVATAIASAMLAVEVLREGEVDPMETLGLALVVGVVLGEARWLMYYIPLDTYLAGLTLLLTFYLVTGLLHSHVIRGLTRLVAAEYGAIATAGLGLVVFARAAGLA